MSYVPELIADLRAHGLNPLVVVGGLIADTDHRALIDLGVAAVFGQGSSIEAIVDYLRAAVGARAVDDASR
jgi:methylmalonyl-CoA mutase C-terminal domain/subunit